MGGHCSVNGTPTRKPSAQTLPPEIERRDRVDAGPSEPVSLLAAFYL